MITIRVMFYSNHFFDLKYISKMIFSFIFNPKLTNFTYF